MMWLCWHADAGTWFQCMSQLGAEGRSHERSVQGLVGDVRMRSAMCTEMLSAFGQRPDVTRTGSARTGTAGGMRPGCTCRGVSPAYLALSRPLLQIWLGAARITKLQHACQLAAYSPALPGAKPATPTDGAPPGPVRSDVYSLHSEVLSDSLMVRPASHTQLALNLPDTS